MNTASTTFKKAGAEGGVDIQAVFRRIQRTFGCSPKQAFVVTGFYSKLKKTCGLTLWNLFLSCFKLSNPAPKGKKRQAEHCEYFIFCCAMVAKSYNSGVDEGYIHQTKHQEKRKAYVSACQAMVAT